MSLVTLFINGKQVSVPSGTTVLAAAEKVGVKIPTLCYDPSLSKPGACRLCVVEIEGMRNLPASCVTPVTEGMIVFTDSDNVKEARATIIELLLANHPTDCLTCEKTGSCKLQDYAYEYGVREVAFTGEQTNYPIDDNNPYILRDMSKCILCGKCVRVCSEVKGQSVLDFTNRGFNTKVSPALDSELTESNCVYCNNCVAVCPVGAIMDKRAMVGLRPWQTQKEIKTCSFCEAGCQFKLVKKDSSIIAVEVDHPSLGRPLCLKGRLGMDLKYNEKVQPPQKLVDGQWVVIPWAEALELEDIIAKLSHIEGKEPK